MTIEGDRGRQSERLDRRRLLLNLMGMTLVLALFLFLPARTWDWARGWLFVAVFLAASTLATAYVWRVNPDLVAARVNAHQGTKRWDRVWIRVFIPAFLAILLVAALDDGRFHWSPMSWWACLFGYALLISGLAGLTWAQAVNKFFEPTVRIQADRGQRVIDTGPYALVRHPGYVSGLAVFVGMALCLGSVWALIPAVISSLLLVLRTQWEDQTLQAELPGYREYAQRVRFKLIPGVW
jgi:protein-S-isoprenylcysteine O-methyltransferase Ste14